MFTSRAKGSGFVAVLLAKITGRCILFNELGAKISLLYALEILKYLAKGKRTPNRLARMKGGVSGKWRGGSGGGGRLTLWLYCLLPRNSESIRGGSVWSTIDR